MPFELKGAQARAIEDIGNDLSRQTPMIRLLHGDVGTGKTIVAIASCLRVCQSQGQSVVLAPTELLCQQHYKVFEKLLSPLGINVVMLTSSLKGSKRTQTLEDIRNGKAQVIVGTHSVFQADVEYKSLYLAIIDEQHRFGIEQRVALLHKAPKGLTVHQLVMTATPIPRTLQLALFSDLDVSLLDELPKNRKPVTTAVMSDENKDKIISRLKTVCKDGTQVYWVCPNIEENEEENASAQASYKYLKHKLPELNIGLIHGQQKIQDRNKIMRDFIDNKISILVATTIIEVGVDVPNASIIIIEGADRLGLAQLHQLRGRVGRGSKESYCILVYKKTESDNEIAMQRLSIMRSTSDGFKIATEDLKLRGPGEVLGNRQAGFDLFRVVDVNRDFQLVEVARKIALTLIKNDLDICKLLIRRWFPKYKVN
ncbi:MAG: ATP-dependent DNA helicase RecG [Succinivibrio sp.]